MNLNSLSPKLYNLYIIIIIYNYYFLWVVSHLLKDYPYVSHGFNEKCKHHIEYSK